MLSNVNEKLFNSSVRTARNFDLNIINYCLNLFGNRLPPEFERFEGNLGRFSPDFRRTSSDGVIRIYSYETRDSGIVQYVLTVYQL